jgi:phosphatidylserine decarboxylase
LKECYQKFLGETLDMNIAQGTSSWILIPFIFLILFGIGYVLTNNDIQVLLLFFFLITGIIEIFFLMFFRDPERPTGDGLVAVADGKIQFIQERNDKDIGESIQIATFMNVHNVHVNRMPIDGTILDITHIPGGYLPAFKKESERNERVVTLIDSSIGRIKVVQIAGTLAKRIVWYGKKKQQLIKGQRFGMIKLGSRVDIIIPKHMKQSITVSIGDRVRAGVDTICNLP